MRVPALLRTLAGSQDLGQGRRFWVVIALIGAALVGYAAVGSEFGRSNLANFLLYVPMGLGLCLLWGYGGVLSFGQAAFFGIAGYTYGILAGNLGDLPGATLIAAAIGLLAASGAAAVFGYFVFYGQVSGWIIPLLTLVLSLILETFLAQTAGYQWRIGRVLLGGYNGMTGIPSLRLGLVEFTGASRAFYLLTVAASLLTYFGLRWLVNARYGHVVMAIRDDTERTRMLGHNVNFIEVQVFTLAGALAGLSGILYVSWGNYANPSNLGLLAATLPVIWVAVGGRTSLLAAFLATLALRALADTLAVLGGEYAFLIMGALLLVTMLFFPLGIIVSLAGVWRRRRRRNGPEPQLRPDRQVSP